MKSYIKIGTVDFSLQGFSFEQKLGEGASATVYRMCKTEDSSRYVLKVFHKLLSDRDSMLRFNRECKLLSNIRHANIVRLERWGMTEGLPWLLFSYEEAVTLGDWLRTEEAQSLHAVMSVFEGLCKGLAYVHRNNVIHRDLKPENILVKKNLTPIIIDFGMAKSQLQNTVQTATGMILGTPAYMAPEIITGRAEPSPVTDTYSAAVILYEMIEGRPLYRGGNLGETIKNVASGTFDPPQRAQGISPKLAALLKNALQKDASRRQHASTEDLLKALSGIRSEDAQHDIRLKDSVAATQSLSGVRPLLSSRKTLTGSFSRASTSKDMTPEEPTGSGEKAAGIWGSSVARACFFTIVLVILVIGISIGKSGSNQETDEHRLLSLAMSGEYMMLGKEAIETAEFASYSSDRSFIPLAGKISAMRLLFKGHPSQAIALYFSFWTHPRLKASGFQSSLFQECLPVLKRLSKEEQSAFLQNIVFAVHYEKELYAKTALEAFQAFLQLKNELLVLSHRIRKFVDMSHKGRYPVPPGADFVKEVMSLLKRAKKSPFVSVGPGFFSDKRGVGQASTYFSRTGTLIGKHMPELTLPAELQNQDIAEKYKPQLLVGLLSYANVELTENLVFKGELAESALKSAWNQFSVYLCGSDDKDSFPLLPAEVFSDRALQSVARAGYLVGDTATTYNSMKKWLWCAPGTNKGETRLNWAMKSFVACRMCARMIERNSSLEVAINDRTFVSEIALECRQWLGDVDTRVSLNCKNDDFYVLTVLAEGVQYANLPDVSAKIWPLLLDNLNKRPIEQENLRSAFWHHFNNLSEQGTDFPLVEKTITYVQSLDAYPVQRAIEILHLMASLLSRTESKSALRKDWLTRDFLASCGKRVKSSGWYGKFPELQHYTLEQLGRAAVSTRIDIERFGSGDCELLKAPLAFQPPKGESLVLRTRWWYMTAAMITCGDRNLALTFARESLPSIKDDLFRMDEGTASVLYSYLLSLGLKRQNIDGRYYLLTEEHFALADILADYMTSNLETMDKELFLTVSHEIFMNFVSLGTSRIGKHLISFISPLKAWRDDLDRLKVNRALSFLAGGLNGKFRKGGPGRYDLKVEIYLVRELSEHALEVFALLESEPDEVFPGDRVWTVFSYVKALFDAGQSENARKLLGTVPLVRVPVRVQEPWLRMQIEDYLSSLHLAIIRGKAASKEDEISEVLKIIDCYKTVSGARDKLCRITRENIQEAVRFSYYGTIKM